MTNAHAFTDVLNVFTTVHLCAQDAKHRHVIVNRVAVASPSNQMIHPVTNAVMLLSLMIPMLPESSESSDSSDDEDVVLGVDASQGASTC